MAKRKPQTNEPQTNKPQSPKPQSNPPAANKPASNKPNSGRPPQGKLGQRKAGQGRSNQGKPNQGGATPRTGRSGTELRIRRADNDAWELVHPRCALDRSEDLEEVRKMIDADELDVAIDELRWLLGGCSDFLDAHRALGELALLAGDFSLARGHFGYAFRLGTKALGQATGGWLPYALEANQAFHEAGKGLILCLKQLDKMDLAAEVVKEMLACDPSDPLAVGQMLAGK